MSRLQSALRAFPPGTIVTVQMFQSYKELMKLIDNDPHYYDKEVCHDGEAGHGSADGAALH